VRAELRERARALGGGVAERLGPLPALVEWLRLRLLPRHRPTTVRLFGRELQIRDAATFLSGIEAIFRQGCYEFTSANPTPLIIDCGANIGLSCIYFKRRYPASRIVAFEPDPALFAALRANARSFGLRDLALYNQAVWISNTSLPFWAEGAFSGRLALPGDRAGLIQVPAMRLRNLLDQPVELLKLDVEGAELPVLVDCADRLANVARLFVEYHAPVDQPQRLHELLAVLAGAGFRYQLKESYAAARPFVVRPDLLGMEYQADIYAYRP
jgi:FkbM family methyltransferase